MTSRRWSRIFLFLGWCTIGPACKDGGPRANPSAEAGDGKAVVTRDTKAGADATASPTPKSEATPQRTTTEAEPAPGPAPTERDALDDYAAFERALDALPRDRAATLIDAIEVFERQIPATASDELKGDAFARVFELREQLAPTVIEEKYVELESQYLDWLSGSDDPDPPSLSPEDEASIAVLVKAGVVVFEEGGLAGGTLAHRPMLVDGGRLPPGARELVQGHHFAKVDWPGCFGEEEFLCEMDPLIETLAKLDAIIPEISSARLRSLLVKTHRELWANALERAGDRPELKTIGQWSTEPKPKPKTP